MPPYMKVVLVLRNFCQNLSEDTVIVVQCTFVWLMVEWEGWIGVASRAGLAKRWQNGD